MQARKQPLYSGGSHGIGMPLRSNPAAISPVRNPTGSISYRVTPLVEPAKTRMLGP